MQFHALTQLSPTRATEAKNTTDILCVLFIIWFWNKFYFDKKFISYIFSVVSKVNKKQTYLKNVSWQKRTGKETEEEPMTSKWKKTAFNRPKIGVFTLCVDIDIIFSATRMLLTKLLKGWIHIADFEQKTILVILCVFLSIAPLISEAEVSVPFFSNFSFYFD